MATKTQYFYVTCQYLIVFLFHLYCTINFDSIIFIFLKWVDEFEVSHYTRVTFNLVKQRQTNLS